jgi:hypothetical protein
MSKPLSLDLRTRVLAAISGGLSCREAAVRFGVSASSDPLAGSGAQASRCEGDNKRRSEHCILPLRRLLGSSYQRPLTFLF